MPFDPTTPDFCKFWIPTLMEWVVARCSFGWIYPNHNPKLLVFLQDWILRTLITCLIGYGKEQSNSVNPDLCMNISYGRGLWRRSVYGHFGLGKVELWMSNCLRFTIFLATLNGLEPSWTFPEGHYSLCCWCGGRCPDKGGWEKSISCSFPYFDVYIIFLSLFPLWCLQ